MSESEKTVIAAAEIVNAPNPQYRGLKPFRGGDAHPRLGGRKKGYGAVAKKMREAFSDVPPHSKASLSDVLLEIARGENAHAQIRAAVESTNLADVESVMILAKHLKSLSQPMAQLEAIKLCYKIGFGDFPKKLDDATAEKIAVSMMEQAIARAEAKAAEKRALEMQTSDEKKQENANAEEK